VGSKENMDSQKKNSEKLPIFKLEEWGVARIFVNTGSNSTIIGKTVASKMGWLNKAEACLCKMSTVTGVTGMLGEVEVNLKPLTGMKKRNKVIEKDNGGFIFK
jgi:hypothetical protein